MASQATNVFITLCFVLKVVLGLYGETVAPRTDLQPFLRRNGSDTHVEKSFQYGRSASNQVKLSMFALSLSCIQ